MKIEIIDNQGLTIYAETQYDAAPPMVVLHCEREHDPEFVELHLILENLHALLPLLNAFAVMHGSRLLDGDAMKVALAALELDREAERALAEGGAS